MQKGFNKDLRTIPGILLTEGETFQGQWRVVELPRTRGQRKVVTRYEVRNVNTREWAWRGTDKTLALCIANRLSGWASAMYFRPMKSGGFKSVTEV